MSLYQRYRPQNLDDVVGQADTVKQLKGFGTDLPRVIGFYGPPGVGKTTLARIVANIVGASEMNIIEKNMGQDTGIDTVREMQQRSQFRPLGGGTTVFILDEFHSASKQAYQGLLKLLEDTPKHCYFVVCTSMPDKIDKAIKTRITGFDLKELNQAPIANRVAEIIGKEGVVLENTLLDLTCRAIAKAANGSMRTALVMLEKVIASGFDLEVVNGLKSDDEDFDAKPDLRDLAQGVIFGKGSWPAIYALGNAIPDAEIESARWFILAYAKSCLANARTAPDACRCILEMREPFFDSKKPGFLAVCYKLFASKRV